MKQTTELISAVFSTLNTVKLAGADGKLGIDDLSLLFPLIFEWQKAIQDLTFAQEARTATTGEIDQAFAIASGKLSAWTPEQKTGFVAIAKGMYYGYWLAANAGYEAALFDVKAIKK